MNLRMKALFLNSGYFCFIAIAGLLAGCGSNGTNLGSYNTPIHVSTARPVSYATTSTSPSTNRSELSRLYRSINLQQRILSRSSRGRRGKSMRPLYISIHSTQNTDREADAFKHALALRNGAFGSSWHYTVDERYTVQHLPTNEQGFHAENYAGTGNKYSIGIEMAENAGNSISRTIDKTARLTAYLMHQHRIPLSRVVPHYHWPRRGRNPPNKNCPHFLLDDGRPGKKWNRFRGLVNHYYQQASGNQPQYVSR